MKTKIIRNILIAAACIIFACSISFAAEFSADVSIHGIRGNFRTGKIYVKGDKIRQEMKMMGRSSINIIRKDKKVTWILMPESRQYMEMPIRNNDLNNGKPDEKALKAIGATIKHIGRQTVNGQVCDKYLITYKDKRSSTIWVSPKLQTMVKTESATPMGKMVMEYKNFKTGKIPDSLFNIPAGYKKMARKDMPIGMPGMRGMHGMPGMHGNRMPGGMPMPRTHK